MHQHHHPCLSWVKSTPQQAFGRQFFDVILLNPSQSHSSRHRQLLKSSSSSSNPPTVEYLGWKRQRDLNLCSELKTNKIVNQVSNPKLFKVNQRISCPCCSSTGEVMKTIVEEGGGDDCANDNNNNNNHNSYNTSANNSNNGSSKLNLNSDPASPPPQPQSLKPQQQPQQQPPKLPNVTVVTLRDPAKVRANLYSANRKR